MKRKESTLLKKIIWNPNAEKTEMYILQALGRKKSFSVTLDCDEDFATPVHADDEVF